MIAALFQTIPTQNHSNKYFKY